MVESIVLVLPVHFSLCLHALDSQAMHDETRYNHNQQTADNTS